MALSVSTLSGELEKAWTMPSDPDKASQLTEEGQIGKVADAIEIYLGDARVSLTISAVTFPVVGTFRATFKPTGDGPSTALAMEAALVTALTGALGQINGIPAPPGITIVSEIATPPIPGPAGTALAAAFSNNQGTAKSQADAVAAAIHLLVMTILFVVVQLVPAPPAPPVPTPIPAVPIL